MGTMDTQGEHCVHMREIVVIGPDGRNHSWVQTCGQLSFGFHLLGRGVLFPNCFTPT